MASETDVLSSIRYEHISPKAIGPLDARNIVALNHAAVVNYYVDETANQEYIRESTGIDDWYEYMERRENPNALVGSVYGEGNLYRYPMFVLVRNRDDEIVSVVWHAQNTSGATPDVRQAKMDAPLPVKRWAWLGWAATRPDYQGYGVATAAIGAALSMHSLLQPASAWAWQSRYESSPADGALRRNGLQPIGEPDSKTRELEVQRYTGKVWQSRLTRRYKASKPSI